DLESLTAAAREAESRRLAARDARRPFDLTRGPLLRVTLLRPAPAEHVMLFTIHHIVSDGWSMGVLIREVAALYGALAAGRPSPLAEPSIQYADFAVWQRQWLEGEVLEQELEYWKGQLAGAPQRLELPTDRPRPAVQSFRGAGEVFRLEAELGRELQALSRRRGATLFMTLLAAFQVLLERYTGQRDLAVGSPIANRNRAEIEGLLGFFVNTLVLRSKLPGEISFGELVARVRDVALGAYAHQDLPFEQLVEALEPERNLSQNPLVQVLFVLQNAPAAGRKLAPELIMQGEEIPTGGAKFDLTLALVETQEGLDGGLEYNTDLFDATTIKRMARHFRSLLAAAVDDPDRRLAELPLHAASEEQQLLVEWNDSAAPRLSEEPIHALFERWAERTPDAVALVGAGTRMSYGELDRRANQLAHLLRSQGVSRPEVPVGILIERSVEMVIGILGILKGGGAYLPIDPASPAERVDFMLRDAGVPVLLTSTSGWQGQTTPVVEGTTNRSVKMSQEMGTSKFALVCPGTDTPREAHLAYVTYTSGSTGRPKGVGCRHLGVVNLLADFTARAPLEPGDACSWWTSPSFDVS
ncbi:MAG: AMP-binding protein, partial [bacterium]|nr:AMP-binding protein [bacterium]